MSLLRKVQKKKMPQTCLPALLCRPRVAEALAEAQAMCCAVGKPLAADERRCRQEHQDTKIYKNKIIKLISLVKFSALVAKNYFSEWAQ
jgi:hypothetical protein